jgi:chromosomal replication initiator protein
MATECTIDPKFVEQVATYLGGIKESNRFAAKKIIYFVAQYYRLDASSITGKSKYHHICWPRHIAAYMMRELLKMSLSEIGEMLGNRDHGTALHSCRQVVNQRAAQPNHSKTAEVSQIRQGLEELLKP